MDFLDNMYFSNSLRSYLISLVIFVGLLIVFKLFKSIILLRLKKIVQHTTNIYDDGLIALVENISGVFYGLVALYVAMHYLVVSQMIGDIVYYIFIIILTWQIIRSILAVLDFSVKQYLENKTEDGEVPDAHKIDLFSKLIKIIIWVIGCILVLSNLGYNVTTLLAGLGIGGIAVALALQNILEDIFSSFSIYIDQPFRVGDYIVVGDKMGTVKKIGIKTTRILSVQGEEVVISNKELTSAHIQNYRKIKERRVNFILGVAYETSNDKLEKIPDIIKASIEANQDCRFERATFKSFGDSNLIYDIVFHYNNNDYNEYLQVQEKINLAIKQKFTDIEIEFAYPTQTIFVKK